jgi:signal transduction histidine kinase
LELFGVDRRWFGVPAGTAIVVMIGILGFTTLIWWTALRVERTDHLRRRDAAVLAEQYHLAEAARSSARALLDSTADAMLLLGTAGEVLTANRQFASLFALDPGFLSAPSFQTLQPAFAECLVSGTQLWVDMAALRGAARPVGTRTVTQVRPQRRDLEVQVLPVRRDDGSVLGHLWTFRNVTAEREVNRLRSEFVSYVSHELRTPLTSIKGFLDIYLEDYAAALTSDQRETLDIVDANAQRLIRLINELLEVHSVEGGGVTLRLARTDIGKLGFQAGAALQPQVAAKDQQLVLDIPDALPPVLADAERVNQILVNLLANAHQYTLPGGRITLEIGEERGWLHVAVRDTGIGMTREDQSRLFTRFFRANDPVVQATRGAGLGLVVTRALVELHGGRMQVQSVKGIGSTFRFTLPVAPGSPPGD